MANIVLTARVISAGASPFTGSELAEVTAYVNSGLREAGYNFGIDQFRVIEAGENAFTLQGSGEFL